MNPAEFDKQITIQYKTKISDSRGGFVETWVDVATVWAKAWTVSSNEGVLASQVGLTRTQKFKIQSRIVKATWRVKYKTEYFNITAIDPDEKNEFIFLTCKGVS